MWGISDSCVWVFFVSGTIRNGLNPKWLLKGKFVKTGRREKRCPPMFLAILPARKKNNRKYVEGTLSKKIMSKRVNRPFGFQINKQRLPFFLMRVIWGGGECSGGDGDLFDNTFWAIKPNFAVWRSFVTTFEPSFASIGTTMDETRICPRKSWVMGSEQVGLPQSLFADLQQKKITHNTHSTWTF